MGKALYERQTDGYIQHGNIKGTKRIMIDGQQDVMD